MPILQSDEIPIWSGSSLKYDGCPPFELTFGSEQKASMMQAIMGRNGPILRAESGSCLIIPIYSIKHKLGLLIHLWRSFELTDEAAGLIESPFSQYPEIADEPSVGFVSSLELCRQYPDQIPAAKNLIAKLAPSAKFHDIVAAERDGLMQTGITLSTQDALLYVHDDFASESVIDYNTPIEVTKPH